MPFVRQPVPTGGWVTSTPADMLDPNQSPAVRNVRFRFGAVTPKPGRMVLGNTLDARPMTIARFSQDDQIRWLVVITDTGLWKFGDTSPGFPMQWVKVTGPVLPGFGRWSWTVGEDNLFFTRDGSNGIWHWDGTNPYELIVDMHDPDDAGPEAARNYAPAQARFVEYFNNRLLAGSVVTADGERWSNRVMWPVNGDYRNWHGDGSGELDFFEPEQEPIQGLKVLGNRCVVLREHSLTDLVATGTLEPVFMSEQRTANIGTLFPFTIASNGIAIFFLGNDSNVWAWNGSTLTPAGAPIQRSLEQIVNVARFAEYLGVVFPFRSEYWLWLDNGQLVIFDFLQGRWMYDETPNLATMGDAQIKNPELTWHDATNPWGSYGRTTWSELRLGFSLCVLIGKTNFQMLKCTEGVSRLEDDSSFSCEIQTHDAYFDPGSGPFSQGTIIKTLLTYEYNGDMLDFEVSVSGDRGTTWSVMHHTPHPRGYGILSWKHTSNVYRIRIRSIGVQHSFRWIHLAHEVVPGGPYTGLDQIA